MNMRGPKSLAGLIAYPPFVPNDIEIIVIVNPASKGLKADEILFLLSVIKLITNASIAVPII